MKSVTSLGGSLAITFTLLIALGFLASRVPVSMAGQNNAATETAADSAPVPEFLDTGLRVDITNVRNDEGKVIVLVFADADAFADYDYTRAVGYAEQAAAGTLQFEFPELREGPYAISLFHDENDDDDLNMDGIYPLEGYGTSGATGPYDEPSFSEAAVSPGRVSIRMYYLR